jgi:hypothetical protein
VAGFTNRGKYLVAGAYFRATGVPTNIYAALCTSATSPTADTNTLSELTEIAAGNGYTSGGLSLSRNGTDFPTLTEDDANDKAVLTVKNLVWTAAGGNLPSSGNVPKWLVLTTDEGTVGNRQILAYMDLGTVGVASDTQTLTISAAQIELAFNAGMTNRAAYLILDYYFRAATPPTQFYGALCTSATAPTQDTNTLGQLTEIAAGNGYTSGGLTVERSATGFPTYTESDASDLAELLIKDLSYTASGGTLPSSGGARYWVLTTDEGTVGNRQIIAFADLTSDRSVTSGNSININDTPIQLVES